MVTLNVKSILGGEETVKKILQDGLEEERKRVEYALNMTMKAIRTFEERFGMSTDIFIEKFRSGEIEENEETFEWWAETKLADELKETLQTITTIEICQQ